jgi:ligand-binding SRPBCC domain-containing protein
MPTFGLHSEQWLPQLLERVFPFFADARNLETITPPWLMFEILTQGEIRMERGTLIDYNIRLNGLRMRWQSEISVWEPPNRFIDEQRRGPYRLWIHEHRFEERGGGTMVFDDIQYAVPGGALIHSLFVKRRLDRIFAFRRQKLAQLFPA